MEHDYLDKARAVTFSCERCARQDQQTIDHIIPLKILADMGADIKRFWDPEDLRILCRSCNHVKGDHLDFANHKTKELLIKYLKLV